MVRLELRYPFREDQDQKGNPEAKQTRDEGGGGRQKATTEVGHSPPGNKAKQIAPLKSTCKIHAHHDDSRMRRMASLSESEEGKEEGGATRVVHAA